MTEEEYKQEWLKGLHNTDYNNCRFAEDKTKFAEDWIKNLMPNVNLKNPQNIVDRINWCKIYDKDKRKEVLSDKISVINELEYMGLKNIIIPTVFTTRSYLTRHDFDLIPDGKYIFKCNHGSGWNMKFEKKPGCKPDYLLEKLKEWYSLNYAYIGGYEWQYEHIIPGVIVQPDLGQLLDWQFWCENGEVKYIQLSRKLGKNLEEFFAFTDGEGNKPDLYIGIEPMRFELLDREKTIYEKMKPIIKKLASDFKFVRVDLYCINGEVKFSEMTFSPCSGKLVWQKVQ
jgi:hypothetical protein